VEESQMGELFGQMVTALQRLMTQIAAASRQADERVSVVNDLLAAVADSGCVTEAVILGPAIYQRPYSPPHGDWETGEAFQAALLVPQGVGVVWDVENYIEGQEHGWVPDVRLRFRPYSECEPVPRALLLPHLEPLLARVFRYVPHPKELPPTNPAPTPRSES
jgi:hypothetical protein